MQIGILPFGIIAAGALAASLVWACHRLVRQTREGRRLAWVQLAVIIASSLALWFGWSFFFLLVNALGHDPNPLLSSWRECVIGFCLFVLPPFILLGWHVRRSLPRRPL